MPAALPIRRVVLYEHGVGYFERKGRIAGLLEHPRTGWEELPPGASPELAVTERTRGTRQYPFHSVSAQEVAYYLSSRFIDQRIADALREIIALKERVAVLTQEEQRLTDERTQLFKDQERIRSNIESLKSGASQRELAKRFVAKLSEQENRLEITARIQTLSYTAELGA